MSINPNTSKNNGVKGVTLNTHKRHSQLSWIEVCFIILLSAYYVLPSIAWTFNPMIVFGGIFVYMVSIISIDKKLTPCFFTLLALCTYLSFLFLILTDTNVISASVENYSLKRFYNKFSQLFLMLFMVFPLLRVLRKGNTKQKRIITIVAFLLCFQVIVETLVVLATNPELSRKWQEAKDLVIEQNVNLANYYFVYIIPFLITIMGFIYIRIKKTYLRIFSIFVIIFLFYFLLQTQFTISLILSALSIAMVLWVYNSKPRNRVSIIFIFALLAFFFPQIILSLISLIDSQQITERLQDLYKFLYTNDVNEHSLDGRYILYKNALLAFLRSPFIGNRSLGFDPHSTLLTYFADLGILGGIPFMFLIWKFRNVVISSLKDKVLFKVSFILYLLLMTFNPIHASLPIAYGVWFLSPLVIEQLEEGRYILKRKAKKKDETLQY